jgi:hypothetical protein
MRREHGDDERFGFYVATHHKFCLTDLTLSKFAGKYDVFILMTHAK